jgi:hypothetical protein
MSKLIALIAAAGIAGGGLWLGERTGYLTANDLVQSAQETVETIGIWPSLAPAATGAGELPEGSRLIEIYAGVRTIPELGNANQKLRDELKTVHRLAASLSDAHSAATRSCTLAARHALDVPTMLNERSKSIAEALIEIDAWMLRVIEFTQKARPAEAGTVTLRYRDFGLARVEFEQTMSGMQSLLATFPRLAAACNLTIPPLRAQTSY